MSKLKSYIQGLSTDDKHYLSRTITYMSILKSCLFFRVGKRFSQIFCQTQQKMWEVNTDLLKE